MIKIVIKRIRKGNRKANFFRRLAKFNEKKGDSLSFFQFDNIHFFFHHFFRHIIGEDLFGLTEPTVVKVLESLPGIESLTDYTFKYGRNPLLELPLAVNPSGCARSELMERTRVKRVHNFQRTTGKFSKIEFHAWI